MLRVVNAELGADFDVAGSPIARSTTRRVHRIEMHLVEPREQVVHIPAVGEVHLAKGESIRTEISCKYDRPSVAALCCARRTRVERWIADGGRFALTVASPRP